jgi:membrane protease YdiL (CAAX protease family)
MNRQPLKRTSNSRSPVTFYALVFITSSLFWLIGPFADRFLQQRIPINLPFSSLMSICPIIAALILVRREHGGGRVKILLKKSFDHKKINRKSWHLPILFLMPTLMILEYGLMRLMQVPMPRPQVPVMVVPVFFLVFFIAALGEEVGWQGYAFDPLQDRWSALTASIILGTVCAIWHIVPMIQTDHAPMWIMWQCTNIAVTRILIVWLYNNTGRSVFAAVLFHAMINVSTFLFPNYGSHYDPFLACIIIAATAAIVVFLWGPETLARFRFGRLGQNAQPSAAS